MKRTAILGAMLVGLAAACPGFGPTALLATPTVVTGKSSTTLQPKRELPPPDVAERLRKAGLDPSSPNLGAQLKALAARTGPTYVRSHTTSSKALRVVGAPKAPPHTQGSPKNAVGTLRTAFMPVQGHVQNVYADGGALLGLPPTLAVTKLAGSWPGLYYFQVPTSAPIQGVDPAEMPVGTAHLTFGCQPPDANAEFFDGTVTNPTVYLFGADNPGAQAHGLHMYAQGHGSYLYYIELWIPALSVGHTRPGSVSFSLPNLTVSSLNVQMDPDQLTVTIDATVDQSPAFAGGSVDPWGPSGIGPGNATLANPGVERVGDGVSYATQTQGDDILGAGLRLGAGWSVTSAKIKSAWSATAPSELGPDNTWRGAILKQGPQGSDLRTLVHWHYSGIDSLAYTVEWTATGPAGQRPLMSMATAGNCGN